MSGMLFLPFATGSGTRNRVTGRQRVRKACRVEGKGELAVARGVPNATRGGVWATFWARGPECHPGVAYGATNVPEVPSATGVA